MAQEHTTDGSHEPTLDIWLQEGWEDYYQKRGRPSGGDSYDRLDEAAVGGSVVYRLVTERGLTPDDAEVRTLKARLTVQKSLTE